MPKSKKQKKKNAVNFFRLIYINILINTGDYEYRNKPLSLRTIFILLFEIKRYFKIYLLIYFKLTFIYFNLLNFY